MLDFLVSLLVIWNGRKGWLNLLGLDFFFGSEIFVMFLFNFLGIFFFCIKILSFLMIYFFGLLEFVYKIVDKYLLSE